MPDPVVTMTPRDYKLLWVGFAAFFMLTKIVDWAFFCAIIAQRGK